MKMRQQCEAAQFGLAGDAIAGRGRWDPHRKSQRPEISTLKEGRKEERMNE